MPIIKSSMKDLRRTESRTAQNRVALGKLRSNLKRSRTAIAAGDADESYDCFEFDIDTALLGARESADDWPPVYTSWRAGARSGARSRSPGPWRKSRPRNPWPIS